MNYLKLIFNSIFCILFFSSIVFGAPTYGGEFEVTREGLGDNEELTKHNASESEEKQEQLKFVELMRFRCAKSKCTIKEISGKWDTDYIVEYSDGWWFKISYDPGCVEFTFKPSTIAELERHASLINDQIFKTANEIGLFVDPEENHHFNLGIRSAFNDDPKKFLRFFVDYANHPDLALGSLGFDLNNGPPLSVLDESQRQALESIIDDVTSGKLLTIKTVAKAIQNRVYTKSYNDGWLALHYQAVGLKTVNITDLNILDAPLELRAIYAQESAEKFILIAKLIEGRIRYLETLNSPIVYAASTQTEFTPTELKTRFLIYVEEAGLRYEDFKDLLQMDVRNAELDDFVNLDAPIEKRIDRIEDYWDLILASHRIRQIVIEILTHPEARNNPKAIEYMQKLRTNIIPKEIPKYKQLLKNFFEKIITSQKSVHNQSKKNIFNSMIHTINLKNKTTGWGTSGLCHRVFNFSPTH